MNIAITMTTINLPVVLEEYIKNIINFNHSNRTSIIIVGDKKTPDETPIYCENLSKRNNVKIEYFGLDWQSNYLKSFKLLDQYLPINSFARRNIADLYAYQEGYDVIIRVDDDNFPTDDDFVGGHSIIGQKRDFKLLRSDDGWFNICDTLNDKDNIPFYPRGFPYSKRWKKSLVSLQKMNAQIVLNAGLWTGDPDVDAITRLCKPINAIKYNKKYGKNFGLDFKTWCPINTQNTSYSSKIIPASFVPANVGRYDDIWSGYLLRYITDHLKDIISYGNPILFQKRNEHNLWDDLDKEINGNIFTDHLIETMNGLSLKGINYLDCYAELADHLDNNLEKNREVFDGVISGMRAWVDAISKIK